MKFCVGNQVGTIIGRKGAKITQIREESACEVKIKGNERDIERIVSVSGSPSGVTRALLKIAEFVEGDLNDGLTGRTTKIPVTLHMIVPTGQCGSIIGKGGFRIKEIREQTGCNVKIANELLPGSTEKLITLYGEPRVIEECVKAGFGNGLQFILCSETLCVSIPNPGSENGRRHF